MKPHVTILLTGGTMDSYFDPITESIRVNHESTIRSYLEGLELYFSYDFEEICLKDSRDIAEDDRKEMLNTIKASESERFLIVHGTYTMPDSGAFLQKNIDEIPGKTVVLTGSMKPLRDFTSTDAPFNLGFALASLLYLPAGAYVAMNGHVFKPDNVYKNVKKGRFEFIKTDVAP